jgi:ABC-type polar amino acid transport system ATPase subunit
VAIVRALMTKPRALLRHEVTGALDPELVGEVLGIISELRGDGVTVLIATHEMGFARDFADEVCRLDEGGSSSAARASRSSTTRHTARPGASSRVLERSRA